MWDHDVSADQFLKEITVKIQTERMTCCLGRKRQKWVHFFGKINSKAKALQAGGLQGWNSLLGF